MEKNPHALELIESCFDGFKSKIEDNKPTLSAYYIFRIVNQLEDSYKRIRMYFANRDQFESKPSIEGKFILELIWMKKYEEAADYFEILINDYYDGKINYLFMEKIFQQLCFCHNREANEIGFNLLMKHLRFSKATWNDTEVELAYFLNNDRVEELCITKFEKIRHVDLTTQYHLYESHIAFCKRYVSERIGKKLWNDFMSKKVFIEEKEGASFYEKQLDLLDAAFNDRSLTFEDKLHMLFQIEQKKNLFSNLSNKQRYINCARKVFEDERLFSDGDVLKKLRISMVDYVTFEEIHLINDQRILDPEKIFNDMIAINLLPMEQRRYEYFSFLSSNTSYQFHNRLLDLALFQTNLVKRILLKSVDNTYNFKTAFSKYFHPLLEQINITDIDVIQKTEFKEHGIKQAVVVRSNTHKLLFNVAYRYDTPCDYRYLAKAINLILIEKNVKHRLIESKSFDAMSYQEYILFEPAKIRAFYDKYELICWATSSSDAFSNER